MAVDNSLLSSTLGNSPGGIERVLSPGNTLIALAKGSPRVFSVPISATKHPFQENPSEKKSTVQSPANIDAVTCLLPAMDDAVANFKGDVNASNAPPSKAMLKAVAKIPVLDAQGKETLFGDLYNPL